jgi:hypothetical protein
MVKSALHLLLPPILLLLPSVLCQYVDDGFFDPRTVKPEHLMTPAEVARKNFLDEMLEVEIQRRLQEEAEDDYSEDPGSDGGNNDLCSLDGPIYCCKKCPETLYYCEELGGMLIEDKYGMLKDGVGIDDSCYNLEMRAQRLDVFGRSKTFRDTPECKRLVWDYTCLWWGSDNDVYTNNCKDKKEMTDGSFVKAAPQPCLSFCTQVANMCANRPDWIKLCKNTVCTENAGEMRACMEGPTTPVGAGTGDYCNQYPVVNFYSAGWRAAPAMLWFSAVSTLLLAAASW